VVTKAEDRGCEGVWEVCGDSFLAYCWMVWWVFSKRDVMWKGEGRIDNVLGLTTAFTKIPAFRNAKLADHWPPDKNSREGGLETKNSAGTPPPGEPENPCFSFNFQPWPWRHENDVQFCLWGVRQLRICGGEHRA